MGFAGVANFASIIQGGVSNAFSMYPPMVNDYNMRAWAKTPNRIPDVPELIALYRAGWWDEKTFRENMSKHGFSAPVADALHTITKSYQTAIDYISLFRRGEINRKILDRYLTILGYDSYEIELLIKSTEYLPGPGDLIRFAVRDVYTPGIVQGFGLADGFPPQFAEEAQRIGMSPETAKKYWMAHWTLPSMSQGYEMFHRGIIGENEIDLLMQAQDIMPFWRDKLRAISYNPLTRVDVRRMYGFGILDEAAVEQAYRDRGYSPENAKHMTEFTVKYEDDETSGLTRSSITRAFVNDMINEDELRAYLIELGYADSVVEFYIRMAIADKSQSETELLLKELETQYELGLVTLDDIRNRLAGMNMPGQLVDTTIGKLELQRSKKVKLPTKADLNRWLEMRIVSEDQYFNRMKRIGYEENDIRLFLTEYRMDQEDGERKYLSVTVYGRWLKSGIMDEKTFRETMQEQNYDSSDIDRFIEEANNAKAGN